MGVFENIEKDLQKIAKHLDLTPDELKLLLSHKRVSHAVLDVDGNKYDAWRIVHNNALGPGKGGIRYHPDVSEDEVKSLSFWMSIKNSLAGLPYGGGKGGVKINPKEISNEQLEKVSRAYVQAFHEVIGQDKDIPAPDVYTTPQVMGWMLDEFEKIKGRHEPGMITGKPLELGGIALRSDSTSRGGFIVLKEFLRRVLGEHETGSIKVAIQGFGNAGMNMAKMLSEEGFNTIAVSDSKGGIKRDCLDIPSVIRIKNEKGTVTEAEGDKITNEELLELDVDVLVLAALENQITKENAEKINADYIVELANGPITSEADEILFKRDITVLPDILANAGGVVVSYFEWANNRSGNMLDEDVLEKKFKEKMISCFDNVYDLFKENRDISIRAAAYIISIKRILAAEKARGN